MAGSRDDLRTGNKMNILLTHRDSESNVEIVPTFKKDPRVYNSIENNKRAFAFVMNYLEKRGHDVAPIWRGDLYGSVVQENDLIISLGGDGTLLETSHYIDYDLVPLLGLTSSETSVGALCYSSYHKLPQYFPTIVDGYIQPKEIKRINTTKPGSRNLLLPLALNDILFAHKSPAGLTRMIVTIGLENGTDKEFQCSSSGIWISTEIGRTGAIKSAGNIRILEPTNSPLIYLINNPQTLLDDQQRNNVAEWIKIKSLTKNGRVFCDGQFNHIDVAYGEEILISPTGVHLNLYTKGME